MLTHVLKVLSLTKTPAFCQKYKIVLSLTFLLFAKTPSWTLNWWNKVMLIVIIYIRTENQLTIPLAISLISKNLQLKNLMEFLVKLTSFNLKKSAWNAMMDLECQITLNNVCLALHPASLVTWPKTILAWQWKEAGEVVEVIVWDLLIQRQENVCQVAMIRTSFLR